MSLALGGITGHSIMTGVRTRLVLSYDMIKVAMLWLIRLLLARRADHKAQDPGLWDPSVTGKMEPGESFGETLLREAEEELALSPKEYIPEFLFETDFAHPDGKTRKFNVYTAKVTKNIITRLVEVEG